jgi:hypothetical protein
VRSVSLRAALALVAVATGGYLVAVGASVGNPSDGTVAPETTVSTATLPHDGGVPPSTAAPPTAGTDASPGVEPPPAATGPEGPGAPAATTAPVVDLAAGVLWAAGMEEGSLASWYAPETEPVRDFGGGVFDSDGGLSIATTERAHTGAWSAKLVLSTGAGGARLFRWRELRAERDTTQRVWLFIPRSYRLTADPASGRFWDIVQFKSISADGRHNDPLWFLNLRSRRGKLLPELVWWHNTLEGPRENQWGYRTFLLRSARVPVGRWFQLTSRIRQSSEFDGIVQFWIDRQKLFDFRNVRTSHRNCRSNTWCAETHWSVNNYSDGLYPAPAVVYADDAVIERTPG